MIGFLLLSAPIFAVVVMGWAATRLRLMPPGALDALGAFSFRFALPALVLRLIAAQPLGRSFNPSFFAGYLASGTILFAVVFVVSRQVWRQDLAYAAAHATTASVSNIGFLAPPLLLAFFGECGAGPLAMGIVAEVMIIMSVGAVIMGGATGGQVRFGTLILRSTLFNPVITAIALGTIIAATGVGLPAPLDRFLSFLGGSAGPTALFAVGGVLAAQRIDRGTILAALGITVAKLVIYPLGVGFVLSRVLHFGPFWTATGVLIAALPSASSNFVLAQRYAADEERVSAGIVLSTIVSVITVPLFAWLILRP